MALRRVAELVSRAAQDTGVLEALKHDPEKLRAILNLSGAQLEALNSASALPLPRVITSARKSAVKSAGLGAAKTGAIAADVLTNGGSLLPPEGSGVFTGGTGFGQPTPAPQPPPTPQPPSGPGVRPPTPVPQPGMPIVPPTSPPQIPPVAPRTPFPSPAFPAPVQPGTPQGPVQPPVAIPHCGCQCCAIAGIVAEVATTAITAITGIVGIAASKS